jgi:hypothetical protein
VAEGHRRQRPAHALAHLAVGQAELAGAEGDVGVDGGGEELGFGELEEQADTAA